MSQKHGAQAPIVYLESLGLRCESYPDFLTLPEEQRLIISESLIPLTQQGFMRPMIDQELIDDVNNHVAKSPRLFVLYDKECKPVAFVCSELTGWKGYSVYELHGIIVDPFLQGQGLGRSLLLHDIVPLRPNILRLTTQNKNMYNLAGSLAFHSETLAIEMANSIPGIEGQVIRRHYRGGHCLYGDEDKFAEFAIQHINWREGDALVVAGFVRKSLF